MENVISFSHRLLKDNITNDDVAIDLTAGNGWDSLLLAKQARFVYSFDIQEVACLKSAELLKNYDNCLIINDSHLNFDKYVKEDFRACIFNLGYLPGGDKTITTKANIVLETLIKLLDKILVGGIVVIVFYPGHLEGEAEVKAIEAYSKDLEQSHFQVLKYEFINQINNPPFLIAIRKIKWERLLDLK